ncbi:MAG: hypothetical protein Q8S00_26590 [Deltaproteobacteria bacterium]|nr:hypothetical protein [Deltaproteobacteria bacterium]MDZ4342817.1 hypothetical protein [Candidatus Binatia bacterium]
MAKKKSHEEAIRRGVEQLRQSGLSIDDASPELIPQLREQMANGKDTALAVVFALGKISDAAAVETLKLIERESTDKEVKREVKRSFFKLAQRGLAVPRDQPVEAKATAFFASTPDIEAYMSSVDGGGGRLVWITKVQPNHGLQFIQAMLHDREGLLRIGGSQLRRKELRKMADDIKQQYEVRMISVPWEYADQILYEGYERTKARGQSGLENFHELRAIINTGKPKEQPHPIYRRLNPAEAREGAWREQSRRLLDEPELRYWILTDEWLQAFLPEIEEAQASRLVLNPVQKEERLAAIVREAVKALCAGENARLFQRRMEDMALYFSETNRADLAKLSLAVALQAGEGDPGPLDVSLLTGLVQKSFAFFLSEQRAKKEEETSLIVRP